jgi:hypothetical protein
MHVPMVSNALKSLDLQSPAKRETQGHTINMRRLGLSDRKAISLAHALAALKTAATPPDLH